MAGFRERMTRWATRLREENIVARMDSRGLSDIGMTAACMRVMIGMPVDVRDRMTAMAAVHGVDPEQIDAEKWRAFDMIQACGHCPHRRACSAALADPEITPERCTFCPNAPAYRELVAKGRQAAMTAGQAG